MAGLAGKVARSQDGGQTWAFSAEGLPPEVPVFDFLSVQHPENGALLYAATRDGLYQSPDQGQTWQRCRRGPGDIEVDSLAWDGAGGMVAATPSGLYRRPQGANQWEAVAPDFEHKRFYDVSGHVESGTIYAGMQSGLVRSTDGGQTWQEVKSDLTSRGMPGVLVDPADPDHLFIRLVFERIYESYDGGQTWQARWSGMETHHEVLAMAGVSTGAFWAGTQEGLFAWDSQARQWQKEPLPIPNQSVFAIAVDPDSGDVYVGATGGLWCRAEGEAWRHCAAEIIQHTVTALAILPNGHLFAGTRYGGLYRSCDAGAWQQVSGIPTESTVTDLLVDADEPLVFAATNRGLFRGRDTACPQPETALWPRAKQGFESLISKAVASLADSLTPAPPPPPVQPLPAVHTLRADDTMLRHAADAGFGAVVQVLSWQEIEPTRGEWHWEYPDFLLQATGYYGLDLIVRLDHPPDWAGQPSAETDISDLPFDGGAYLNFVETLARRYRGRIRGYIIWNEPNLASEWGGPPDPQGYTRVLQRAYQVVKQEDSSALVISAGLSSTNGAADPAQQPVQAMDDRLFLEKMYQAGAGPFFDALGAHPYGFAYPPDDPPGAHHGLNMNRLLDLRAIMEAHGDEAKSVWATEIGWTTRGTGAHAWQTVTPEEQADYLRRAWAKAQSDFPWLDVFTVWNLSQGLSEQDEKAGYSLLDEAGLPKTAYGALKEVFAEATPGQAPRALSLRDWLPAPAASVAILARDEEVHLGDSE